MARILFWKSKSKELLLLSFWWGFHAASFGRKGKADVFVHKRAYVQREKKQLNLMNVLPNNQVSLVISWVL